MINCIKLSDLLKYPNNIKPFLYGVLFSRVINISHNNDEYFYICGYTSFKVSKVLLEYDFENLAEELIDKYNRVCGYKNWTIHKVISGKVHKAQQHAIELRFYIKNDLNVDLNQFNNLIYKTLMQCDWIRYETFNDEKKDFVRGYMEMRGSVDIGVSYMTQDYYYSNRLELLRINVFLDFIDIPIQYLNFNQRETQPNSKEKNSQFRIDINWYASKIGFINRYKSDVYNIAYKDKIGDSFVKDDVIYFMIDSEMIKQNKKSFVQMISFYTNNIYKKELTEEKINELRKHLGYKKGSTKIKIRRSKTLIEIFSKMEENKCACCGVTQTFSKNTSGKQDFEIHHMISVFNDQSHDNIANLVKLCSTCHDSLKKGRASREQQLSNIRTILDNKPSVRAYACSVFQENNINKLAEFIFEKLG